MGTYMEYILHIKCTFSIQRMFVSGRNLPYVVMIVGVQPTGNTADIKKKHKMKSLDSMEVEQNKKTFYTFLNGMVYVKNTFC